MIATISICDQFIRFLTPIHVFQERFHQDENF